MRLDVSRGIALCGKCEQYYGVGEWPWCPHGVPHQWGVIDDQLEGGARFFETLGHEPVWIESKSQLRREAAARGLENRYAHTADYYAKKRRMHDEELRDTGANREY